MLDFMFLLSMFLRFKLAIVLSAIQPRFLGLTSGRHIV